MRSIRFLFCVAFLAVPAVGLADVSITLAPASGAISGLPGSSTGWGFTIYNSSPVNWVSFTETVLVGETNPALGAYVDFLGAQGGPTDFSVAPMATWTETFSAVSQTGVGEYQVNPSAGLGAQDSGVIRFVWDEFSGDPLNCNCIPASFSQDVAFQVTVAPPVSATPEPGALWPLLLSLACITAIHRRYARRSIYASMNSPRP